MVTLRRIAGTDVFAEAPTRSAKLGVVSRRSGDAVELDAALLADASFVIWGDLSASSDAEIQQFAIDLRAEDELLPDGVGAIFFRGIAGASARQGTVTFRQGVGHALFEDATLYIGSTELSSRYRVDIAAPIGPHLPRISLRDGALHIESTKPEQVFAFLKGIAPAEPTTLASHIAVAVSGEQAGTLSFSLHIERAEALVDLGATLRSDYEGQDIFPTGKEAVSVRLATLAPRRNNGIVADPIRLEARIDPFDPTNEDRSFLAIGTASQLSGGVIESFFTTNYGEAVQLRVPDTAQLRSGSLRSPRFVFAAQGRPGATFSPEHSLLPDGDFEIVVPTAGNGDARESFGIMCGLSEREYVVVEPGDYLAFRARQPAFGGALPELRDGTQAPSFDLDAQTLTSWIAIRRADGEPVTTVVAEDPDYSLFEAEASSLAREGAPIKLVHEPAMLVPRPRSDLSRLSLSDPAEQASLPILPWRGAQLDDPARLRSIETRSLVPARRFLLEPGASPRRAFTPTSLERYTPLGLEMTLDPAGQIRELLLARSVEVKGDTIATLDLRLTDIDPRLSDALLRTNLFLVLDRLVVRTETGLEQLAKLQARIAIAGWTFDVDLSDDPEGLLDDDSPVIIIKGMKGNIRQLLDTPEAWAGAGLLYPDDRLAQAARKAKALHAKRPSGGGVDEQAQLKAAFAKIDQIFDEPDGHEWTGVLVYNLKLIPSELPDQITGLMAGARKELDRLRAHHLGVDVRRPEPGAAKGAQKSSPLFAAIAYAASAENEPAEPEAGDVFATKLSRMVVSFGNGEVRDFNAKVLLTAKQLFDGEAKEAGGVPGRSPFVRILGTYESRYEGERKIDVYSFKADLSQGAKKLQLPPGGLIEFVSLSAVTFTTTQVEAVAERKTVRSRFTIDGEIGFNDWPKTTAVIRKGQAFRFSGLGINVDFDIRFDTPDWLAPKFAFSPGGLSVDFSQLSSLGSLLGKMPFKFRTFEFWPDGIDLAKLGFTSLKAGRSEPDSSDFKFGFTFDLALGSLGAFAQKLKDFKLSLLLGFGYAGGTTPRFALGFKLAGSGGGGLDIKIGNILAIKADGYDVGQHPTNKDLFFLYALNAQLVVNGRSLPDPAQGKLNLFVFLDPGGDDSLIGLAARPAQEDEHLLEAVATTVPSRADNAPVSSPSGKASAVVGASTLPSVGWFAVITRTKPEESSGPISVGVVALGQRVNPFLTPPTTSTTKAYVDQIETHLGKLDEPVRQALEKRPPDISKVTGELVGRRISYDLNAGWTFGLRARVAQVLAVDLLIHDPKLYGARVALGPKGAELFDLDVLYRKLSDDLGVYSVTFVLPPALRQISAGPAEIRLPAIGFEIFTDGGFHANLGYPYNRDFSSSAAVEIFPFTGGGGIRAGWFKGGGSSLIPTPRLSRYRYEPVIEVGIGVRVGLGKSFERGPFRAGFSLTVYSYLQGAYGKRRDSTPDLPDDPLAPAAQFWVVQGTWGILGEVYGHVDFKIVKARVDITLFVETGVRLRTHDAIQLRFEVGVSVRVRVVVASFRIFRKRIVIYASFRFDMTLSYATTLGSRHPRFDKIYIDPSVSARLAAPVSGWRELTPEETLAWLAQPIDWRTPSLETLGLASKLPLDLWFLPDVTAAAQPGATDFGPEIVFKLFLEREDRGEPEAESAYDRFARIITIWTLWCGLSDLRLDPATSDRPLQWTVSRDFLELLARKITGPDDGTEVALRLPTYRKLADLFSACLAAKVTPPPGANSGALQERNAITFPVPPELELVRYLRDREMVTALHALAFVTPELEAEIEHNFQRFQAIWERDQKQERLSLAPEPKPMAAVVFEEFFGFMLRGLSQAVADLLLRDEYRDLPSLLDTLRRAGSRYPARDVGAASSRFFNHGLAFPKPGAELWAQVREKIPPELRALVEGDALEALPLYRFASLQLPLQERVDGQIEPVVAVGARASTLAWFELHPDAQRLEIDDKDDRVGQVAAAAKQLARYAAGIGYEANIAKLAEVRPIRQAPSYARALRGANGAPVQATLFGLPSEQMEAGGLEAPKLILRNLETNTEVDLGHTLVAAVDLRVRKVRGAALGAVAGRQILEMIGVREEERRVLDALYALDGTAPKVLGVELFRRDAEDDAGTFVAIDGEPIVVQTNLAVEPKPESLRAAEQTVAYTATLANPGLFVEIVRRAGLINSGGYWLVIEPDALPADGPDEMSLLLLATIEPHSAMTNSDNRLRGINALKAYPAQNDDERTARFASFSAAQGQEIAIVEFGQRLEALARPGMLPLSVRVENPARAYILPDDPFRTRRTYTQAADALAARRALDPPAIEPLLDQAGGPLAHLQQQFNLLEVLIDDSGTGAFGALTASDILPLGDTAPATTEPRLALSDEEPPFLEFRLALQLHRFLRSSTDDDNPYAVVGKQLHLKFRLRDIHGNSLPGKPRDGRGGTIEGPITVQYCDGLVPLAELPGFVTSYDITAAGVALNLRYEPGDLQGLFVPPASASPPELAGRLGQSREAAKTAYTNVLRQVNDSQLSAKLCTTLAGSGLPRPGYDPATPVEVPVTNLDPLRAFLRAVLVYLKNGQQVPPVTMLVPIAVPATASFVELSVELVLRRRPELVPALLAGVHNALETRYRVPASFMLVKDQTRTEKLAAFASEVTRHLLKGYVAATGTPGDARRTGEALWMIRRDILPLDRTPAKGVPIFVAIPPLKNAPASFDVQHLTFHAATGTGTEARKLSDIDADAYGKLALDRIEALLSPRSVRTLSQVEAGRDLLERALHTKEVVAADLARRARPILEKHASGWEGSEGARAVIASLRSRLMGRLTAAYEIDTVLCFRPEWAAAAGGDPNKPGERPMLYGRLPVVPDARFKSEPVPISAVPLPMAESKHSDLLIFYDAADDEAIHQVSLGRCEITHVQRLPQPGPEDLLKLPAHERYRSTQWLRLLSPWIADQFAPGAAIPIVRRELPVRPRITGQRFAPATAPLPQEDAFSRARRWSFEFDWAWAGKTSDVLLPTIDYDRSSASGREQDLRDDDDLARRLVGFVLATDPIWDELLGDLPQDPRILAHVGAALTALATAGAQTAPLSPATGAADELRVRSAGAGRWRVEWNEGKAPVDRHFRESSDDAVSDFKGCVRMGGIDVLRRSSAKVTLDLYRNRDFAGERTHEAFVYHIGGISAGEPLTPRLDNADLLESPLRAGTFAEHVEALLGKVFARSLGATRFDAEAVFHPEGLPEALAPAGGWPGVPMPGFVALSAQEAADVRAFAAAGSEWLERQAAPMRGFVRLKLTIYGGNGQAKREQPVLRLNNLRVPLARVTCSAERPMIESPQVEGEIA